MASKHVVIGTAAALAGFGGLGAAALAVNTPDTAATTANASAQPPAKIQTVAIRTVEDRVKRAKADDHRRNRGPRHSRAADDHRRNRGSDDAARAGTSTTPVVAATPTQAISSTTSGRSGEIEPGDDHGGQREVEAGDDRGGQGEVEPGDDRGGQGEVQAGNDHGGNGEVEAGDHHGRDRGRGGDD